MPSIKNNHGFGYLPILAISALVLTGTYFGYSWYTNNSKENLDTKLSEVVEENNLDKDVLQAATRAKVTATMNFTNPSNLPIRFDYSYFDPKDGNKGEIFFYYYGKDKQKLEEVINIVRKNKLIISNGFMRPCVGAANSWYRSESIIDPQIEKISDNLYLLKAPFNLSGKSSFAECKNQRPSLRIFAVETNTKVIREDHFNLDLLTLINKDNSSLVTSNRNSVTTNSSPKTITNSDIKLTESIIAERAKSKNLIQD